MTDRPTTFHTCRHCIYSRTHMDGMYIIAYILYTCILYIASFQLFCLQCFDAVGWVAGRASGP